MNIVITVDINIKIDEERRIKKKEKEITIEMIEMIGAQGTIEMIGIIVMIGIVLNPDLEIKVVNITIKKLLKISN